MTKLETVELRSRDARVVLAPERGGMVTRFEVAKASVLYLDDATLVDQTKNVRGGNPILFPSPGPLTDKKFTWHGKSGALEQHGFARNRPWRVVSSRGGEAVLELTSDDVTRSRFPWDFRVTFRHVLDGARLRIEQRFENKSADPMPFATGFHPYFHVADADKARTKIPTRATRGWDNVAKKEVTIAAPIDLTQKEVDLHLYDHNANEACIERADGHRVVVRGSREYERWVVWTQAGKDFVCLEPWTAPADALNRDADLIVLGRDEARELFVEIELL